MAPRYIVTLHFSSLNAVLKNFLLCILLIFYWVVGVLIPDSEELLMLKKLNSSFTCCKYSLQFAIFNFADKICVKLDLSISVQSFWVLL